MKIAGISDIHGKYCKEVRGEDDKPTGEYKTPIAWPEADVLVFAGDILKNYSWERQEDAMIQLGEVAILNRFIGHLKNKQW